MNFLGKILERKHSLKENEIGHLEIRNYKFERVENFKYLGVILNADNSNSNSKSNSNSHQMDLQGRIKNDNKTFYATKFFS
jgi:hypothetical protein